MLTAVTCAPLPVCAVGLHLKEAWDLACLLLGLQAPLTTVTTLPAVCPSCALLVHWILPASHTRLLYGLSLSWRLWGGCP